jgi:hypothetical protein
VALRQTVGERGADTLAGPGNDHNAIAERETHHGRSFGWKRGRIFDPIARGSGRNGAEIDELAAARLPAISNGEAWPDRDIVTGAILLPATASARLPHGRLELTQAKAISNVAKVPPTRGLGWIQSVPITARREGQ